MKIKAEKKILLWTILPLLVLALVYVIVLFGIGHAHYLFPSLEPLNVVLYFVFMPMLFLIPAIIVACLIVFLKHMAIKNQKNIPKRSYVVLYVLWGVIVLVYVNVCVFEISYDGIHYSHTQSMDNYLITDKQWITTELSEYFPNKDRISLSEAEYSYSYKLEFFEDPDVDITLKLAVSHDEFQNQSTSLLSNYNSDTIKKDGHVTTITIFDSRNNEKESGLIEREFTFKEKKIIIDDSACTITYQYLIYHFI